MTVKFVHIHIPKTAGTSVTSCMKAMFGNHRVAHYGRWQRVALFRSSTPQELAAYKCIGGHIRYIEFLNKVGRRPLYFSIMRDPLDRYLSFYSDIYYRESHLLHDVAKGMSATEFLHESISQNYIAPQTLYLSRDQTLASARKLIRNGRIVVQTLEHHDRLLNYIAQTAGKTPEILPRKNRSKRDLPVNFDELEPVIRTVFQDDFKLFDFVKSSRNPFPFCAS